jgi:hypothetical protein
MPEAFMTLLRENRVSGMTALQSLYRLYEIKPEAAQQLLDSPTLITAVGVAQANATAPTPPSMQETISSQASHSPDAQRKDGVASASTSPAVSGEVRSFPLSVANPARVPQVHKVLPIRIRVHYDNENWIVDYTRQRGGVDGTLSVRLEGANGGVCFASLEMLKLQSIEIVE